MDAWSSACPSCSPDRAPSCEKPRAVPALRAPPTSREVMEDWSKGQSDWMELVPSGVEEGQSGLLRPRSQSGAGPAGVRPGLLAQALQFCLGLGVA